MRKIVLAGNLTKDAKEIFYAHFANNYDVVEISNAEEIVLVKNAEYIITRGVPFQQKEIAQLEGQTRLIHRWGVGYDSVDIQAAAGKGIAVAICTGGNAQPVAEMTVLLMLAAYRRLPDLISRAKQGTKNKEDIIASSYLLQGKLVGLIGLGHIGKLVCKMLQGFGASIQYYDPFRAAPEVEEELHVQYCSLKELLQTSDIVSIHVPLLDSTRHMIGAEEFQLMKPSALLVNTARGGIVDTQAMLAALDEGRIAGAALDTIEGEPLPAGHPIFAQPNILLTPHGAGNTCDNIRNMCDIIIRNIEVMESGGMPDAKYVVNAKLLKL